MSIFIGEWGGEAVRRIFRILGLLVDDAMRNGILEIVDDALGMIIP